MDDIIHRDLTHLRHHYTYESIEHRAAYSLHHSHTWPHPFVKDIRYQWFRHPHIDRPLL